jgi:hypothetical protein
VQPVDGLGAGGDQVLAAFGQQVQDRCLVLDANLAQGWDAAGSEGDRDRVKGVGHAVVLAGLPDDRVAVVLAAVMDGHTNPRARAASRCCTSRWPMPFERLAGR